MKLNSARTTLALLAIAGSCWAEIDTRGGQIELELVSEVRSIQPGQPFSVALHIVHDPTWHTYWKSPGIVGVATRLEWDLPRGFEAGEIHWPPPENVPMATLNAWGYEREILLIVDIKPPADLEPGSEVVLKTKSAWMACARTCHPGFGNFTLSLPVSAAAGEPDFDPDWRERFEAERATLPRPLPGWKASVEETSETEIILTLTPESDEAEVKKSKGIYFFSYDNQVDSNAKQKIKIQPDGSIRFRFSRPDFAPKDPEALAGLVFNPNGWPELDGARFAEVRASWEKD